MEPFAGSAAVTIAAARQRRAKKYLINDALGPLAQLWRRIIDDPDEVARGYEELWLRQLSGPQEAFNTARATFNQSQDPVLLLYLLARCVKAAIRFNAAGEFNQSPDHRRLGTRPSTMKSHLVRAAALLGDDTEVTSGDFRDTLARTRPGDFVYFDPPYQGVSGSRDTRYYQALDVSCLITELGTLNDKGVPFALSYDGSCGDRRYGSDLPASLGLVHLTVVVGRSSQATLAGRKDVTVESLYLSPTLAAFAETSSRSYDLSKRSGASEGQYLGTTQIQLAIEPTSHS